MRELCATELHAYLARCGQAPVLLDVREPWEFDTCHIKGSILIPMRSVQQRLNELDTVGEIVVICHHGIRSRIIARMLEQAGFGNIINLSDGIDGWAKTVAPTMPTY